MLGVVVAVSFVGAPPPAPVRSSPAEDGLQQALWQGVTDPSDFLVLLRFPNEAAAQDDLRQLVETQETSDADVSLPSEVHHIAIEHEQGAVLDEVPIGGYLVVAKSMASPGYGEEARERLHDMLSTFVQVEGYHGHIVGFNETVEEESWGFVFGRSGSQVSLPESAEVAVSLYQRLS